MAIALLSSTASNAEASQIIGTVNGVIQDINQNALLVSTSPTSLRNAVIGGDFGTNPWQRGTSFTTISNTLTYTADRFWALGGASSSISVSQQTGTPTTGFAAHLRFGRANSNSDTTAIKLGQVLTSAASTRFQGQPFVISFWARAGAGFSAASSALSVTVGTGTGSNESAANYASGSWTGYAGATLYDSTGAAGSTATLTTSFQRFSFAGVIPVAATQIGFNIAFTPVGTATNDYIEITGVQFEVMPQGGVNPTPFEWRPASLERALCQHYFFRVNEPASSCKIIQGQANTSTVASLLVNFPVPMLSAPTTAVTSTTCAVGSFTLTASAGAATSSLTSTGLIVAANSGTVNGMNLTATLTAAGLTAGNTTFLIGGGGAGTISASAEL